MMALTTRVLPLVLALLLLGPAASAQYDYGGRGSSGYGSSESGFLLFIEGGIANPRNADNVVATIDAGGVFFQDVPTWDDDLAARIGFGYRWAGGDKIVFSAWGFQGESVGAGSGSVYEFPIGPTTGNAYDVKTEITGRTADLYWEVPQEATDRLGIDWTLGLRYAYFEETADGTYVDGLSSYVAAKSNEGTMIGVRAGTRARYRVGAFSAAVGVGLSFLDGELEASASLTPQPAEAVDFHATDDGRSGTILDLDVTANWHLADDFVVLSLGWEQSVWQDIASDLARNLPGTVSRLRDRDSVTFSGYKLGVHFQF